MDPIQGVIAKLFGFPKLPADEQRKRIFLAVCILISVPATTIYGLIDGFQGRSVEAAVILGIGALLTLVLFLLRHLHNMIYAYRFSAVLVFFTLIYEMSIGGGEGYAFLWFYFYPITLFFIFGRKEGLLWVLGSMIIIALLLFTRLSQFNYGVDLSVRFFITYLIVTVISYALESSRSYYYRALLHEKESLEVALLNVKTLKGLLPLCAHCKKVRDDQGYWNKLEAYLKKHSEAEFSHGICPECATKYYPDLVLYEENNDA